MINSIYEKIKNQVIYNLHSIEDFYQSAVRITVAPSGTAKVMNFKMTIANFRNYRIVRLLWPIMKQAQACSSKR